MALFKIFKKEKTKKNKEKEVVKIEENKSEKTETPKIKKEKESFEVYRILKKPHMSEKATDLTKKDQYVFDVHPRANKPEIKKAIESFYGVDVLSVNMIKIPAKAKRMGRNISFRKGCKKAVVTIKKGQKIEVFTL